RFDIGHVLVPADAGVGSCVGLVRTDLLTERSRTRLLPLSTAEASEVAKIFDELVAAARSDVRADEADVEITRSVAMRFAGQAHELDIELTDDQNGAVALDELASSFERAYEQAFGIAVHGPKELV